MNTSPGMTLRELGYGFSMPQVETPSGAFERPTSLTRSTIRAAPKSASLRRGIGVEPA